MVLKNIWLDFPLIAIAAAEDLANGDPLGNYSFSRYNIILFNELFPSIEPIWEQLNTRDDGGDPYPRSNNVME